MELAPWNLVWLFQAPQQSRQEESPQPGTLVRVGPIVPVSTAIDAAILPIDPQGFEVGAMPQRPALLVARSLATLEWLQTGN